MATALSTSMLSNPSGRLLMTEQRQHRRAPARMRAAFKPDGYPARGSFISNISLGGAWMDMRDDQPAVDSEGKLHVVVGDLHLYLIAKVVRQNSEGIGVTFIDMGIETYENLKQLVEQLSAAQSTS